MPATINFFNENTDFELRDKARIRKWLERCARQEGKKIGALNYIFCNDSYLRNINKEFLNHDYNTDIVTFPESGSDGATISGELYISIDRVRDNANHYNVSERMELHRVMVHGLLHLCGYDDKTAKGRVSMRIQEDACLELLTIK